jgi:hypothetical protein
MCPCKFRPLGYTLLKRFYNPANLMNTVLGITLWPPVWPMDFVFMTATPLAKLPLPSNARLLFVLQNLRVSDLVSTCDV